MKYKNFTLKFDRSLCSFIVLKTLKGIKIGIKIRVIFKKTMM